MFATIPSYKPPEQALSRPLPRAASFPQKDLHAV
jgi:hypothetical protein